MSELKEALINISEEVRTKVIPENIKAGIQIFDTEGEYTGIDTSDATATAESILVGKTAYVNGEKVTGIMEIDNNNNAMTTETIGAGSFIYSIQFPGIVNAIKEITGDLKVSGNDATYLFANCANLTAVHKLDTSNVTSMGSTFYNCTKLLVVPEMDTSNVTGIGGIFSGCSSLKSIPNLDTSNVTNMQLSFYRCESLTSLPELNTAKVTTMKRMCEECVNLVTVPLLDTSSVTDFTDAFKNCTSLSDESLNNILAMCINATSFKGSKTRSTLGIYGEQATKCTTLPNYQAFLDAGWQ